METADYIHVVNGSAGLCLLDRDNLDAREFATLRDFHSNRLKTAWEHLPWPDLKRTQQRFFRLDWSSVTAYAAPTGVSGNEVYYPPTASYYQALRASTNQAPATGSPLATNLAYWALAATTYSASEFSATPTYTVGDQVSYQGNYYQLYLAAAAGTLPTDATKWGRLTVFDRYVSKDQTGQTAIGEVFAAWDKNPRLDKSAVDLTWELSQNGVQVLDDVAFAWLDFRIRCPQLTGAAWSATATYTAALDQVYFAAAGTPGNFYNCAVTTTAGQSPATTPASWTKVELPLAFQRYLVHGGAGDYLSAEQRPSAAGIQHALAEDALAAQSMLLTGQQQQRQRTVVMTR